LEIIVSHGPPIAQCCLLFNRKTHGTEHIWKVYKAKVWDKAYMGKIKDYMIQSRIAIIDHA